MAKHLFLTILEPAKSIIRVPAWSDFWWGPFSWLTVVFFFLCLHMVEKEGAPISFMGTNLVMGVPHSWTYWNLIASWKPHFLIPSHWELGLQYMNWGMQISSSFHVSLAIIQSPVPLLTSLPLYRFPLMEIPSSILPLLARCSLRSPWSAPQPYPSSPGRP